MINIREFGVGKFNYPRQEKRDTLINHLNCNNNPDLLITNNESYMYPCSNIENIKKI